MQKDEEEQALSLEQWRVSSSLWLEREEEAPRGVLALYRPQKYPHYGHIIHLAEYEGEFLSGQVK